MFGLIPELFTLVKHQMWQQTVAEKNYEIEVNLLLGYKCFEIIINLLSCAKRFKIIVKSLAQFSKWFQL